jgi:hypothetical protein
MGPAGPEPKEEGVCDIGKKGPVRGMRNLSYREIMNIS